MNRQNPKYFKISFYLAIILSHFFLLINTSHAIDKELAYSAKCVKALRFFETKYKIPKDTLYSISLAETGKIHSKKNIKISWPWTVNVEGQGYYFDSKKQAIDFVRSQLSLGKQSIDVGCMQINLKHHPEAFKSLEHAFDPRFNVAYGAQFLLEKYNQLGDWAKAIANYHSATPHLGQSYKNNVLKIAQNIDHYKSAFKISNYKRVIQPRYNNSDKIYAQNTNNNVSTNKSRAYTYKDRKYRSNMMIYMPKSRGYNS